MIGDFLREAAVLVVVFGLLDPILRTGSVPPSWIVAIAALSGFLLMSGIVAELTRKE
jgi:hypothetical protein